MKKYEVIVIGGGHAGCEAAAPCAKAHKTIPCAKAHKPLMTPPRVQL